MNYANRRRPKSERPTSLILDSAEPLILLAQAEQQFAELTGSSNGKAVKCRRCGQALVGVGDVAWGNADNLMIGWAREIRTAGSVGWSVDSCRLVTRPTSVTCSHCNALQRIHPPEK